MTIKPVSRKQVWDLPLDPTRDDSMELVPDAKIFGHAGTVVSTRNRKWATSCRMSAIRAAARRRWCLAPAACWLRHFRGHGLVAQRPRVRLRG